MDNLVYNTNFNLYNGKPANNYYSIDKDGITKYYDELLNELNEQEIKELGIFSPQINLKDETPNSLDINVEPIQKGDGKRMIGGGYIQVSKKNAKFKETRQDMIDSIFNQKTLKEKKNMLKDIIEKNYAHIKEGKITPMKIFTSEKYLDKAFSKITAGNMDDVKTQFEKFVEDYGLFKYVKEADIDPKKYYETMEGDITKFLINTKQEPLFRGLRIKDERAKADFLYDMPIKDPTKDFYNDAQQKYDGLYILLKILYPLLIQPYGSVTRNEIIENNHFIIRSLINNKYLFNNKFYLNREFINYVDKEEQDYSIIESIMAEYIKDESASNFQKGMYFFNKAVKCLNKYCFRPALPGPTSTSTKQRQECKACTKYRKAYYIDPQNAESIKPIGYFITVDANDEVKAQEKTYTINVKKTTIGLIYEKFCYNNKNLSYWTGRDGTLYQKGVERGLDETDFDPAMKPVEYFDKNDKINKALTYKTERIIKRRDKRDKIQRIDLPYFCELSYPHDSYPSDIIEIDHISGNHQNNSPQNIQPLCKLCHAIKTYLADDKAEVASSISAMDLYLTEIQKDETKFKKLVGIFYLYYAVFITDRNAEIDELNKTRKKNNKLERLEDNIIGNDPDLTKNLIEAR